MSDMMKKGLLGGLLVALVAVGLVLVLTFNSHDQKTPTMAEENTVRYTNEITPEQALEQFEKTHTKYSTVDEATENVTSKLKAAIRVPKKTKGASLVCSYVANPGQASSVSLRYSNNMEVDCTEKPEFVDYAGMVNYMKDLDTKGYGQHSTQPYVTDVNGHQAIAMNYGENHDGSKYGSFIQWSADGAQYLVSSASLTADDLLQVASSMY